MYNFLKYGPAVVIALTLVATALGAEKPPQTGVIMAKKCRTVFLIFVSRRCRLTIEVGGTSYSYMIRRSAVKKYSIDDRVRVELEGQSIRSISK